jgi:hypothetical protein
MGVPIRDVICLNCELGETILEYQQMGPGDPAVGVRLDKKDKGWEKHVKVIEPRLVGYVPTLLLAHRGKHLEAFVGRPDRQKVSLSKGSWKEQECWVIEYTLLKGDNVHVWIAPALGNSVVRILVEGNTEGTPFRSVLESDVMRVGSKEMWYPRSVVYATEVNGVAQLTEEIRVTQVAFNEPIDPGVFTLAGIDIAEGVGIAGTAVKSAPGSRTVWSGSQIVDVKNEDDPARPVMEPGRVKLWVLGISALAACFAAWCLWQMLRTRSPTGGAQP